VLGRHTVAQAQQLTISYCNALAQERGVRPGQSAYDACLALLRASQGTPPRG
jgi:sulfur relay (sulfurtransferase) complex TusBCD TusD component (DsrE family)